MFWILGLAPGSLFSGGSGPGVEAPWRALEALGISGGPQQGERGPEAAPGGFRVCV